MPKKSKIVEKPKIQLFINMDPRDIPTEESDPRYDAFWDEEERKVLEGVTIDGFTFSGWLYWHINHWWINKDRKLSNGETIPDEGRPDLRDNELLINDGLLKAQDVSNRRHLLILGARQIAKDLLDSSILYTPDSEITIGNCKVGDKIYNESGNLVTIVGKYPQGVRPVYSLTLRDGREIKCGLEHNWYVWDRHKSKYLTLTTKELLQNYKHYRKSWKGRTNPYEYRYYIDAISPVKYPDRVLSIDPYILGLWLGDGHSSTTRFTNVDQPIIEAIIKFAEARGLSVKRNGITYSVTSGIRGGTDLKSRNSFKADLQKLNLINNKHIPELYRRSSIAQRLELLRGMMDSDGTCSKAGILGYSTTSDSLAAGFEDLCRSLGISVTKRKSESFCTYKKAAVKSKDAWLFNLHTSLDVFKLSRKLGNVGKTKKRYQYRVPISDITYVGDYKTTCIEVDGKSKLFLTDGYTPTHNTTFEASFLGRSGLIYKGSQNLILSTGAGDLNNITASLDFGLLNCSKYFRVNRITKDWDSERVVLGTETKGRDRKVWAQYIIRNTSAGKKTESGAGVTIKSGIYDEIGKAEWLEAFKAAEKAMVGRYGIRALFIAVGTGGSFEKGENAQRAFFNPDSNKFVKYIQPDGRETGMFISGLYRQDCKVPTTLAAYLLSPDGQALMGDKAITYIPEDSELWKTAIDVSDKELAYSRIMEDREAAKLDPDPRMFIKTVAYDPLTVDEIFLTATNNRFAHLFEDLAKHKLDLEENYTPRYVELFRDKDDQVLWRSSDKRPVWEFPVKPQTDTDAPVVIYEEPVKGLPYATYVCGIDPYNQDQSIESKASLGSCYIFKRMHDPMGNFQDAIVASYTGRPATLLQFYQICENMIDMYKAIALPENEGSIVQYFIQKKKEHVLFDSPALTRYINPNSSTASRQKGLAATTPNQEHYMKLMLSYVEERIIEIDYMGRETNRFGLIKIPDPLLLKEMMDYRGKDSRATRGVHEGNFDRICAFGHCLTLSNYLDRDFPVLGKSAKVEKEEEYVEPVIRSPFPILRKNRLNAALSPFRTNAIKY